MIGDFILTIGSSLLRLVLLALFIAVCNCPSVLAFDKTPLSTGNGFGFAVVSPSWGCLNGLYAHPYKFVRPDPIKPLDEGIETTNFIDRASWQTPSETNVSSDASYVKQSQIIEIKDKSGSQFLFMPFGLDENALIYLFQPDSKSNAGESVLHIKWKYPVQSVTANHIAGCTAQLVTFVGAQESLLLVPLSDEQVAIDESATTLKGPTGWAFLSLKGSKSVPGAITKLDTWLAGTPCQQLVQREIEEVEQWRVTPSVHFASDLERQLWRQSEIVLRMGQIRESDSDNAIFPRHNQGLILASLPDGAWWVPWVRDMVYATLALEAMGHRDEAGMAIRAFFNARPVGQMEKEVGGPYQVSVVRYFGDGSEEPFFTMEGSTNIELDNWGLALWALGDYCRTFPGEKILDQQTYRGTIYESAKNYIVRPLLKNLEPYKDGLIVTQDTSIWEEKQKDKKHFAYTTICAIKGLESFALLAKARGDETLYDELMAKVALLRTGFQQAFASTGKLRGTLEAGIKNEVDGATLSAINLGTVTDKDTIAGTIEAMSQLKMASGGYRRVHSIVEDPEIFEYWYERQEFLFINFSLASVYLRTAQPEKASALIAPMVEKAALDNYFVPEMYVSQVNDRFKGEFGAPTGAIPMVGYGAGVYISYILERERLLHPVVESHDNIKSQFFPGTH
jgi:hypothetical protein